MKILCALGRHDYGDPARGAGHEFANFVPAFEELGHEVMVFDTLGRSVYSDFGQLNSALADAIRDEAPDVLFSVLMHYEVWAETFELARSQGCATVNWMTDDSWRYPSFSRLVAGNFDVIATTDPNAVHRYRADGHHNVVLTQWAAGPSLIQPPLPADECRYGVTFVGSAHGDRRARIERLRARGIDVECFGYGWESGPVAAADIPEIVRGSLLSLNFANPSRGSTGQLKARVFEVPASGGCLLTEASPGLDDSYEVGREVFAFGNDEELASAIERGLSDHGLRDAVAEAGFERTRAEHTYMHRFPPILDAARDAATSSPRGSVVDLGEALRRHRLTPLQKALRAILTVVGTMVLGREKGPRAARKLVFEISWRLAGKRTYSAAGWPGRMFYRES